LEPLRARDVGLEFGGVRPQLLNMQKKHSRHRFTKPGVPVKLFLWEQHRLRSGKVMQKRGMKQEGILSQEIFSDGEYHDLVVYGLLSMSALGQEFASDEATANRTLTMDEFDNIAKLLYAGKLAPHMKCDLKVRTIKEERTFSTGKKLVEIIEVVYYPRGIYADTKSKF
jgi:hypothetical protein